MSSVTLTIERLGGLGDGMATHNAERVLVPKSAAGDVVEVTLRKTGAQWLGDIQRIITPSPDRADTPCPHYALCGGCALQHLKEEAYRAFKRKTLSEAVRKAGYADYPADEVIFLPAATRRRADFTVTREGEIAYLQPRSHIPAPVKECMILTPALQQAFIRLWGICDTLRNIRCTGIKLTEALNGIDMALECENFPSQDALHTLLGHINPVRITRLHGDVSMPLFEREAPLITVGKHDIPYPAGAFLQPSVIGQETLTRLVMEGAKGTTKILDLFCGIGTYSLPLAESRRVHAVEGDAAMVQTLKHYAKGAGLSISTQRRDLFKHPFSAKELAAYDGVVINSPRAGAKAQCGTLARAEIGRIVMVSCNPATFARDAAALKAGGWKLVSACGIDQFVWSAHLEIVAVFSR